MCQSTNLIDLRDVLPPPHVLLALILGIAAVAVFPLPRWRHYVSAWLVTIALWLMALA